MIKYINYIVLLVCFLLSVHLGALSQKESKKMTQKLHVVVVGIVLLGCMMHLLTALST